MAGSTRPISDMDETLRIALWVAVAALVGAVVPIWPYGYYVLLRLIVTAVSIFAVTRFGTASPGTAVGLIVVALLFNPVIPVHLTRALWFPIDLGIAYWFWTLTTKNGDGGHQSDPK